MQRRVWLVQAGALLLAVPAARGAAARVPRLAAAWDDAQGRHHAGWLEARDDAVLRVQRAIELPTRAHGLWQEPGGQLLVVARRPGDWLLRWPADGAPQWQWNDPERKLCGHVLAADGALFTTESDTDTGAGRIVRRDARSLAPVADWPSHGIDPHQLLRDADGSLLVANGGVPTRPESGRLKIELDRMDPSLVRLDAGSGELRGQWRLHDARLSIRHLARHAGGAVGIALQSEHDDAAARRAAPLLALFDGQALRSAAQPPDLAGYAGDIVATPDGFALAATRAGGIARWTLDGQWAGFTPLPEACPLAMDGPDLWAGGRAMALRGAASAAPRTLATAMRLDNHWTLASDR